MKTIAGTELKGRAQLFGKTIKLDQKLEDLDGAQPATIRTVIPFQLKSLNDEDRTIEFVGSTAAVDRMGDSITQAGWDVANFLGNPVVPWGHDYSMPPVAKALEVGLSAGALTFKAQFATADEYAWADTIYKLYKGGYLRAFSVGFIPKDYTGNWETGYTFTECELLEVSCVTVPANPEALVLAYKEGVLSETERKDMVAQAERLVKTLTDDDKDKQNEDMETAKALAELNENIKRLADLLEKKGETEDTPVEVAPVEGDKGDKPNEEAEASNDDAPEDEDEVKSEAEASDGAADETEAKSMTIGLTADDVREAVKTATKDALDYQLGKIK